MRKYLPVNIQQVFTQYSQIYLILTQESPLCCKENTKLSQFLSLNHISHLFLSFLFNFSLEKYLSSLLNVFFGKNYAF